MGKLGVLVLLAVVLPIYVYAQGPAQVKANDQCVPGNYGYDWRTTKTPCDTTDESKKCRLNRPCFEEVNGARVALGVCTAEKFCSTRSVRVCDGAECSWRTPDLTKTPPETGGTDGATPVQTLQPGESLLESALQRILGNEPEPTSPAIDAAQSKLRDALEQLAYSSEDDMAKNYDLYRQAEEDLAVAKRLQMNAEPSLRDYLRGVVGPRLTPTDQLPGGESTPSPTQPRDWFNRTGSTFGEPYKIAEAPGALNDGPPVPLQVVTDAARAFEEGLRESMNNWIKLGQQEIAETVRNWQATGIPGEYTMPTVPDMQLEQAPRTYTFDSVGGALSCGVFGFGCPEPTFVIRETQYTEADLQRMLQEELARPIVTPLIDLPVPPVVEPLPPPVQPVTPVEPIPTPARVDPPEPPPTVQPVQPALPTRPTLPTVLQPTPQLRITPTPFAPLPTLPITTPIVTPQLFPFQSWLPSIVGLLSSLMQSFNAKQQPTISQPQQTKTQPILTVAAEPQSVRFNERVRIAWASVNWRNNASVTCRATQLGISLGTGGATGSVLSNAIVATTSVTVFCSETGNTSLQHTITIPFK